MGCLYSPFKSIAHNGLRIEGVASMTFNTLLVVWWLKWRGFEKTISE
jgi:hypothetical protein